jgi:hypothetical protein
LVAGGAGGDGIFWVYSVSLNNDERLLQDQWLGANIRETHKVPSHLWIRELTMEGRMVKHLKNLYSRREGVLEETDSRERVEDMLKEEKELTKMDVSKLDMGSNAV